MRRESSTRPVSITRTTSRSRSVRRGSRPRPCPAGRRRLKLAEILARYERGEIDVLINAQLLAEGWNSPRATVVMHLAPTASKRVYQQRIGRIMRIHPRKEAGIVVDFHAEGGDPQREQALFRCTRCSDADFYREGARHARLRAGGECSGGAAEADARIVAWSGRRPTCCGGRW